MNWTSERTQLQFEALGFDQSIRLVTKNHWFWKVAAWILFILSFGQFKREKFLTQFATTLGHIQAYPEEWSVDSVRRTLPHESRHTNQFRICGFGIHPMVGLPLMTLLYGLFVFPIFFAFFRFWSELDAEQASWRYAMAHGASFNYIYQQAEWFAELISGPSYLWAVWKPLATWLSFLVAEKVIAEFKN